jgi:hypothetical protein
MLEFINTIFKGLFTVIIVIALIAVVVAGFIFMNNSPLRGFLVWIGGFIIIILSAGLVSMLVKINENLQKIIDQGLNINNKGTYEKNNENINVSQNNKSKIDHRVNKIYMVYIETPLKFGSSSITESIKILEIGTKVKFISENVSGWYCVETLEGEKGFCASSNLRLSE